MDIWFVMMCYYWYASSHFTNIIILLLIVIIIAYNICEFARKVARNVTSRACSFCLGVQYPSQVNHWMLPSRA